MHLRKDLKNGAMPTSTTTRSMRKIPVTRIYTRTSTRSDPTRKNPLPRTRLSILCNTRVIIFIMVFAAFTPFIISLLHGTKRTTKPYLREKRNQRLNFAPPRVRSPPSKVAVIRPPPSNVAVITPYYLGGGSPIAPWDPQSIIGGDKKLRRACPNETQQFCQGVLPLQNCLANSNTTCLAAQPCQSNPEGLACRVTTTYVDALTKHENAELERIFRLIDKAATDRNVTWWLTAGSATGAVLHHSRIPWDDDVDIYILDGDMPKLSEELERYNITVLTMVNQEFSFYKIVDKRNPEYTFPVKNNPNFTWPFIDAFDVNCKDHYTCVEFRRKPQLRTTIDHIFPLVRRPFGRLSLPAPGQVLKMTKTRYGEKFQTKCITHWYNHKLEKAAKVSDKLCDTLPHPPVMVDTWGVEPWKERTFTVEHLMDGETRLSSVVYDEMGHEVRRSYADGLVGVEGNVITYHPPTVKGEMPQLVPFLPEERESYLLNVANRSAEVLNEEVLPMLDRVEIANKFISSIPKDNVITRVQVAEWNAFGGEDWKHLAELLPDADIVILNEMDWGMSRSGNIHTTELLSERLQMNYAYGVEFLELANSTTPKDENNMASKNTAGYHGNAVLSKWPILTARLVRLHRRAGEAEKRRLGSHVALFVTIVIGDVEVLFVSAHSHLDSEKETQHLKQDAATICEQIVSQFHNSSMIVLGGAIAGLTVNELVSTCGFQQVQTKENKSSQAAAAGNKVDCPGGSNVDVTRMPNASHTGWLLVRGSVLVVDQNTSMTTHQYNSSHPQNQSQSECIHGHPIIGFRGNFSQYSTIEMVEPTLDPTNITNATIKY
jgi:hypothetical protein